MQDVPIQPLSVAELFAERDARRHHENEVEAHLRRKKQEELDEFKKRLDTFVVTEVYAKMLIQRIKRAFEQNETELMFASFPSSFCTDGGRAIANAESPPINKPAKEEKAKNAEPEWLGTLPKGAQPIFEYWNTSLRPGGFGFFARIINYPNGMPGDVGLFISWPRSSLEAASSVG